MANASTRASTSLGPGWGIFSVVGRLFTPKEFIPCPWKTQQLFFSGMFINFSPR